ncbi:MAG TPA: IS1380 family transposase [Solirubrobacteraceae bacterium]|nr:IS1380 family transposase [Solirubrobacteraceae bacterium]
MVKQAARLETVDVTADGQGLVSHAGAALLVELADRAGLTGGLSAALAETRERRSAHDPGRVLRDVAVMLADGGDCVTDIDAYRGQERLFGARASETTTQRVLKSVDEQLLGRVRAARAAARERVWDAGARPASITLNIDATLLTAHSDKQLAAGTYKHGYGFHPICCYLDETGEALAAVLRPGNAGSNTAADHFEVLALALEQLPAGDLDREILVRTDIGGATHAFCADCREADIRFSVGYELGATVRTAILALPGVAWVPAIEPDGEVRDGAWVAELTEHVDLSGWPQASRLIVRRERPHPGAQFTVFDDLGYRYTCMLTDQTDADIAGLELGHRGRARVEDSIRQAKDCGMRNLPHHAFEHNQTWLELSLIAQDLLCWMRLVCLDGALAHAEPKRLRHRLLHVAGRVINHGRRTRLRLQADWPWASILVAAFTRLRAIPALC